MSFYIKDGFSDHQRSVVAALYWQAFCSKLAWAMNPKPNAIAFLERVINPNYAISAVTDTGDLLGIAGFKTKAGAFVGGTVKDLAFGYGWMGAVWRACALSVLDRPIDPSVLLMDGIFVRADARGQGVGSVLLETLCTKAARQGYQAVRLDVIDTNVRARALYERHGFRQVAAAHMGPFHYLFGFRSVATLIKPVRQSR